MITNQMIRDLRVESTRAGNHAQALLCDLALGEADIDESTGFEALRIWSFLSTEDKERIRALDPREYRAECASAILKGKP